MRRDGPGRGRLGGKLPLSLFLAKQLCELRLTPDNAVHCGIKCRQLSRRRVLFVLELALLPFHLFELDSGYRGNLKAALDNAKPSPATLCAGTRLLQICMPDLSSFTVKLVSKLDHTKRGEQGLGSTGL